MKEYFGFSTFRPYQKEVVTTILKGNDAVVIMATGSGKSIWLEMLLKIKHFVFFPYFITLIFFPDTSSYQLPPLISKKTAVVISPLLSLMQDQVSDYTVGIIRSLCIFAQPIF
jgi:ATP-dependent DNA helicase RecQ